MTRRLLLILIVFLFAGTTFAQVGWQWVRQPITTGLEGYLCAADRLGNIFGGGTNHVVRYDTAGHLVWAINSPGFPIGMHADDMGNLYLLSAYTSTTLTVGSRTLTNAHPAFYQFFIIKYDTSGAVKWAKNVGTAATWGGFSYYKGITTDEQGNIYVTCPFTNNATLGSWSLINHDPSPSDSTNDILVAKMDSSGSVLWAENFGGKKQDAPSGITVTRNGTIYIAGSFTSDTMTIGNVLTDTFTGPGNQSRFFVARLNNSGTALWGREQDGTSRTATVNAIAADNNDNAFVSGTFGYGSLVLGSSTIINPSLLWYYNVGFIARYDSAGSVSWVKETRSAWPKTMTIDRCANIWVMGGMSIGNDTLDGHIIHSPAISAEPVFVAGWASSGTFINASALGSGGDDMSGIATDCRGNLYMCSDYEIDTLVVGPDTIIGPPTGEYMYLARYNTGVVCDGCPDFEPLQQHAITGGSEVSLYPNPACGEYTISIGEGIFANGRVSVFDMSGRLMQSTAIDSRSTTISAATLPAGIYQCRVRIDNGTTMSKKLVIIK